MGESSNNINFENTFRTHNKKKPLALSNTGDKHTSSETIKPQDVLASVSKQLRDIQKADYKRKKDCVRHIANAKSEFVSITVLSRQEAFQPLEATKFETQCVTDTQLIDVADSVEAMVKVENGMSQEFQRYSGQKHGYLENTTEHNNIVSLCRVDNDIRNNDVYKECINPEIKQLCNRHQVTRKQEEVCIDDTNTRTYKEFNMLYNETDDEIQHCIAKSCGSEVEDIILSRQIHRDVDSGGDGNDNNLSYLTTESTKVTEKPIEEKCNYSRRKSFSSNGKINKRCSSCVKNNLIHIVDTDLHKKSETLEEKKVSTSPVFQLTIKSATPSPLIFPLNSFEKFASLAMPLIEQNLDFEAIKKHLINSQIVDNQLLMPADSVPVVQRPADNLIFKVKKNSPPVHDTLLDIDRNKDDHVEISIESTQRGFEDEMLFSSDEENDYCHNCVRDLPVTCAMKTPFYESQVDLDETVFVGFQTNSNKCIQVYKDSFVKAKNIFNSIDKESSANLTLTELVDIYDSNISTLNNNLPSKCVTEKDYIDIKNANTASEHILNIVTREECNVKFLEDTDLLGFKTANGKSIDISEKALFKCKTIFKDIEEEDIVHGSVEANEPNSLAKKQKFVGFKTASNKKIKLSEESLSKISNIFKDIDLNLNNVPLDTRFESNHPKHKNILALRDADGVNLLTKSRNDVDDDHMDIVDQSLLQEFENESIEEDFHKLMSNAIRTDLDETEVEFKKPDIVFRNSENLFKDLVINSDINKDMYPGTSEHSKFGFKTANNKQIRISREALAKTKDLFHDIGFEDLHKRETNIDDNVEFNKECDVSCDKNVRISVNIITDNNEMLTSKSELYKLDNKHLPVFQDFEIAKAVEISKEALLKSRNLFKNDDSVSICRDEQSTKRGDSNGSIKFLNSCKNMNNSFQGFKSASNKPVYVSEEACTKTKKIFEDINIFDDIECTVEKEPNHNYVVNKPLGFQGFKTASDKQVVISEDALARCKHIFKDVDFEANISLNKNEDDKAMEMDTGNLSNNNYEIISEERKSNVSGFKGFQTANNKCVNVSDEAIARSRKIFDEINFDVQSKDGFGREVGFVIEDHVNKENINMQREKEKVPIVFGFKTAMKKSIKISEDALKKSRQLYSDLENNLKTAKKDIYEINEKRDPETDTESNINIINTQLLNNFEDSLHTEDFHKDTTPKQCKRSGSPILSCPKAKKRKKFEAPYRSDTDIVLIQKVDYKKKENADVIYGFSENYKISKLYLLKELDKIDKTYKSNATTDPYILNFDFDTLLKFEFEGSRNDFSDVRWTVDNIKTCFVESVNKNIIPEGWLDNHLKLILWKLISYEFRFPNTMTGVCSVRNVLEQLKYRYDKELYRVERPALRKLLEKDDISTRTMILVVVGVYVDGVKVRSITNPSATVELLVTDGWYCVKATTDRMMSRLVCEGKIAAGRKIATAGAELLNCEQGVSPWEDTSSVRLKLFGNSTRPARWDARLGHATGAILSQLSAIDPSGGKVCKTLALVARVYPPLYVERLADGSTVPRSERLEHLHQMKYETERQMQMEKLYEEAEKEFFDQDSSESEGMENELKKSHQSGSQLNRCMKNSNDPSQFRSHLTDSQAVLLQEYSSRKKEKVLEELQRRVHDKVRERGLHLSRNVVQLLKIRVAGFEGAVNGTVTKAMISIWRPNDEILEHVKEGAWIDMFNVVPTAVRNSELQMSAGGQSVFHRSKYKEKGFMKPFIANLRRKCFTTKELNNNPTLCTDFNEIDTVGVVFMTEPSLNEFKTNGRFQNVYLTDVDKNFICLNFWGGVKRFGYENIFDTGNIVACVNLQKRVGNTGRSIPQYRATELTVFTKTPKLDNVRNMIDELNKNISSFNIRKFCEDCVAIKNNFTNIKHNTEFSPYRLNISDHNLTRNKIFIDSPLAQNKDVNLNLTGLDFESKFQQSDTHELSPTVSKRKQLVEEKIAKLKMYGEPPPLSKIHIVNKSKNAGKAYKSPLTGVANVARVNKLDDSPITTNKSKQSSPILSSNRTFVVRPGVNPVKLNFSSTSLGDEKMEINPFEEEFEASPPLSLD